MSGCMRYKISFPAWIWLWQHVISRSLYNWIFQSAWTNHFVSSSLRYSRNGKFTCRPFLPHVCLHAKLRKWLLNAFRNFPAEFLGHGFPTLHCNWFRTGMLQEHMAIMNLKKTLTKSSKKLSKKMDRTQWLNNILAMGDWKKNIKKNEKNDRNRDAWKMATMLWKASLGRRVSPAFWNRPLVQSFLRWVQSSGGQAWAPSYHGRGTTSQLRKWSLQQKLWKAERLRGKTTCLQNFGKTICAQDSLIACAIRCGAMDMFQTNGMKQWYRQCAKIKKPGILWRLCLISLLAIGYSQFAPILLPSLKVAGADYNNLGPRSSAFELSKLCRCLVCCNAFVGTNLRPFLFSIMMTLLFSGGKNSQWKLKPGNLVSSLSIDWSLLMIHWWWPRAPCPAETPIEIHWNKEIVVFACVRLNYKKYGVLNCLAKLPAQPWQEFLYSVSYFGSNFGCLR